MYKVSEKMPQELLQAYREQGKKHSIYVRFRDKRLDNTLDDSKYELVGLIDSAVCDYDDGAYFLYAFAAPGIIDGQISYTGANATEMGIAGQSYAAVHATLGIVKSLMEWKVRKEEKRKEITEIDLLAKQVVRVESFKYSNLDNSQLYELLRVRMSHLMREKHVFDNDILDATQINKANKVLEACRKRYEPEEKKKIFKVFDAIETGTDLFTRVNTAIGMGLYAFYYFGSQISSIMKMIAVAIGPLLGLARFLSKKESDEASEKAKTTIDDFKTCYKERISLLKRLNSIDKMEKELKEKKDMDVGDVVQNNIASYYSVMRKKVNKNKHAVQASATQLMVVTGFGLGVIPVKIMFWLTGAALASSAFFIAAPIMGVALLSVYIYKNYKALKQLKEEINSTIDRVEALENERVKRWNEKYEVNVTQAYLDEQYSRDTKELLKDYLIRVLLADNDDEFLKFFTVVSETTKLKSDIFDEHFYNRLVHYLGNESLYAVQHLKEKAFNGKETKLGFKPEKPGFNYKKAAKSIGHFMSVAAPVFMSVYLAATFFSGGIGLGVMLGLIAVALIFWGIGKIAIHLRAKYLKEVRVRESKIKIIDRINKVNHKHGLKKENLDYLVVDKSKFAFFKEVKKLEKDYDSILNTMPEVVKEADMVSVNAVR